MKVVAMTRDLMDASKIRSAIDGVEMVRPGAELDEVDVLIVDLSIEGAVDRAVGVARRVIAYGSHVDEESLAGATAAGAEAMPRSVFFRRLQSGDLFDPPL